MLLQDCADEPINRPGAVQPHGVLLGVQGPGLDVVLASANAAALFQQEVLGRSLSDLLDPDAVAAVLAVEAGSVTCRTLLAGRSVDLVAHRSDGLLVLEAEPVLGAEHAGAVWHAGLPGVLQRLSAAATVEELGRVLVVEVRALTGFDRVMLYRFDEEWNGEVVAESLAPGVAPFLGLHFPASDIPAQARSLYEKHWLRLIPDTAYTAVALTPVVEGAGLELGGAVLRSVSPVHLQYLANMGVAASMSVSLLQHGRLWGLIACHHTTGPHRPSYADRLVAEFLGRTASVLLAGLLARVSHAAVLQVSQRHTLLVEALARVPHAPGHALTAPHAGILDLVPVSGAAVRLDGVLTLLGATPPEHRVAALVPALLATDRAHTSALADVVDGAADVADVASGVLVVPLGRPGDFLAWFRPEVPHEVHWAGDPGTAKDAGPGAPLSPRTSFEKWSETVRGTAAPWRAHEVAAAQRLGNHLTENAARRVERDNQLARALQRTLLLEAVPEIPGLEMAAHYTPAEHDVVGGDWYDLILLPGGRVAVVLGDVAGHGLSAAATTAQLRHGLRAYLLRDDGPAAALDALNALVVRLLPGELATAVVAELDPTTGTTTIARAGHPPALLLTGAGPRLVADEPGPALGLSADAQFTNTRFELTGADCLLLYSDGLVERREGDLAQDLDRLLAAAALSTRAPGAVLEHVLGALRPGPADDVTLLAVGLSGQGQGAPGR